MQNHLNKVIFAGILVAGVALTTGCNTVRDAFQGVGHTAQGVGQDISNTANAVDGDVHHAKHHVKHHAKAHHVKHHAKKHKKHHHQDN